MNQLMDSIGFNDFVFINFFNPNIKKKNPKGAQARGSIFFLKFFKRANDMSRRCISDDNRRNVICFCRIQQPQVARKIRLQVLWLETPF